MKIAMQGSMLLAGACLQWAALAAESENGGSGIWRCGNSYSDRPCQEGRPLDIDDGRSSEEKRIADQHTRDARAFADRLERERLQLESVQGRRGPVLIGGAQASDQNASAAERRPGSPAAGKELRLRPRKDPVYRAPADPSAAPKRTKKTATKAAKKQAPPQPSMR